MNTSKIIKAYIGAGTYSTTESITQGDYGYILQIEGAELPAIYRVDFSNDRHDGEALPVYGNENGAEVPKELIDTGKDIFAFYYYVGENFGKTAYTWKIPNDTRAKYGDREPTPTQQDSIDQLIVRSNEAVETVERKAEEADTSARSAKEDADRAEQARDDAQTYANNAQTSATQAITSASQASASASASANSASQSAQIKADVEDLVDDAQGYAQASAQSASASANSASQASEYAQSASASAQSASISASNASTSAQTASTKVTEASTSAQTASQKATESAQSASQALTYKTDAESAKVASQTAQGLAESARDSAISAKNDAESAKTDAESARDEAQQAVASISDALADKAPVITDTASGAIALFSDGADDLPLKSLVVDINPVQDLHGYDSPWPAGGGANKFKYNASVGTQIINGVTWTLYEDGSVQVSGTSSGASTFHYVLAERVEDDDFYFSGNYKFYAFPANISTVDFQGGVKIGSKWYSIYANGYSIDLNDIDGKIVEAWFQVRDNKTVNATIRPMIYPESEPIPTAWSPYENICPISGWTQVDVEQRGKNIYDIKGWLDKLSVPYTESNGYVSFTPTSSCYSSFFELPSGTKTLSFEFSGESTATNMRFRVKYANGTIDASATTQKTGDIVGVALNWTSVGTIKVKAQIEFGSTATPYEPYTGRSITINLGQTVYGGNLDAVNGGKAVTRVALTIDSASGFNISASDSNTTVFRKKNVVPSGTALEDNQISNFLAYNTRAFNVGKPNTFILGTSGNLFLQFQNSIASTLEQLDTLLASTPFVTVYMLNNPVTEEIDPIPVSALYGVNNIWADTGDTEVEYRADTKLYIEKLTQPTEDDMVANSAIASGQFFMIGNSLYRALANIASGATITVGTNAQRVSLSDALNLVNA